MDFNLPYEISDTVNYPCSANNRTIGQKSICHMLFWLVFSTSLWSLFGRCWRVSGPSCLWSGWIIYWQNQVSFNYLYIHTYICCSVMFDSLRSHGLYSPWNSPGQNTGVGSLALRSSPVPLLLLCATLTPGSSPQSLISYHHGSCQFGMQLSFPECCPGVRLILFQKTVKLHKKTLMPIF